MDNKKRKHSEDESNSSSNATTDTEYDDNGITKIERVNHLVEQMSIIKKQIDEMENMINRMNAFYIANTDNDNNK
jgi:hypothetical protein